MPSTFLKLFNTFQRITLVSKHSVERLTLDIDLSFQAGGTHAALPGIAIAEVIISLSQSRIPVWDGTLRCCTI